MTEPSGERAAGLSIIVAYVGLMALAVNSVLIQTIITDEDSYTKNIIRAVVLVLACAAIAVDRARLPTVIVLTVLVAGLLLIIRNNSDQLSYIFVLIFGLSLARAPRRSVIGAAALASVVALGMVFAFLATGVTHNEVLELRNRATFGTKGVPFFFNLVYGAGALLIVYCLRYRRRVAWVAVIGVLGGSTILFSMTDARGGYFSLLLFVVLLATMKFLVRIRIARLLMALAPVLFIGASFLIARFSDDADINALLSERPILLQRFLQQVDDASFLLGTSVKNFQDVARDVRTVDNSYLHLLAGGGLWITIFFCVLFAAAVYQLMKEQRPVELSFLFASAVYCNSESILIRIDNPFVVVIWYLVMTAGLERMAQVRRDKVPDATKAKVPRLA